MTSGEKSALIAMSGGVDSSVAAYLMKEQGYSCMGVTMRLYRNADIGLSEYRTCCSERDIEDAAEAAFQLDIPHEVLDFTKEFGEQIIGKFIRTYEAGGVPNPCIDCNRHMKFDRLFDYAAKRGIRYVATGHYARVEYDSASGHWLLKKAADPKKDQSYVLYMLTQEQLSRLRLPLGETVKEETRAIAERLGLLNARKRDSQDICFVPDGDYAAFMERVTGKTYPDGGILDGSGRVLGVHHGAVRYTRGQRRGLGVSSQAPLYVTGKDMEKNEVYVGPESALYSDTLFAEEVSWVSGGAPSGPVRVEACTRYRQEPRPATAYPDGRDRMKLVFDSPQRAVTRGQAVVMYDGDTVVGGGTITEI